MNLLLISGTHKSGTSWLTRMVGEHPEIALSRHELWLLGYPDSLAETIEAATDRWLDLPTVASQFRRPADRSRARKRILRASLRSAIMAAVENPGDAKYIGDKSPNIYAVNHEKLRSIFPGYYYIHISRDPRDVLVSLHYHWYRRKEWRFFGDVERAKTIRKRIFEDGEMVEDLIDPEIAKGLLDNWKKVQLAGLEAKARHPERVHVCRYEDLIAEPGAELSRIFDFLGLDTDAAETERIRAKFDFARLTKGRDPGTQDPESFYRKGVAGDWKNYFSSDEGREVLRYTEVAADRLGYS